MWKKNAVQILMSHERFLHLDCLQRWDLGDKTKTEGIQIQGINGIGSFGGVDRAEGPDSRGEILCQGETGLSNESNSLVWGGGF